MGIWGITKHKAKLVRLLNHVVKYNEGFVGFTKGFVILLKVLSFSLLLLNKKLEQTAF